MSSQTADQAEEKAALRVELRARRSREARNMPKAGMALAERFPEALLPGPGGVLSAYAPFRDEIEPGGVMARAVRNGATVALPVVVGRDQPLVFRVYAFGDPLETGPLGLREPGTKAAEAEPDVLLVPLLGFDHFGWRLGYGGGHYDRTLARLRAKKPVIAVGLAFEVQRLDAAPLEAHDQRLDWIVTEAAAYEAVRGEPL